MGILFGLGHSPEPFPAFCNEAALCLAVFALTTFSWLRILSISEVFRAPPDVGSLEGFLKGCLGVFLGSFEVVFVDGLLALPEVMFVIGSSTFLI